MFNMYIHSKPFHPRQKRGLGGEENRFLTVKEYYWFHKRDESELKSI